MVKLINPMNHGGTLIEAGAVIQLPPDIEASLIKSGNAEKLNEETHDESGAINQNSSNSDDGNSQNESNLNEPEVFTFESLMKKRADDLKKIAVGMGLPIEGEKKIIAEAILEALKNA